MFRDRKVIALCTSRVFDSQIHQLIQIINENIKQQNCSMLVYALNSDAYWEEDFISAEASVFDLIPYPILDAILIMDEAIKSRTISQKIINKARENGIPVIVVDGQYDGVPFIKFDYEKGFELIARHMFEEHHIKKPIMMAGIPGNTFSQTREDIFKKLCKEFGIPFEEGMIAYGYFWANPCIEAMNEVLKSGREFDSVICANDIMAINVCDVLSKAGIRVPDDVLVSGFDGIEEAYFTSPLISTASCETSLLAHACYENVLRILNGEPIEDTYILPKLLPNESCGCPSFMKDSKVILSMLNNNFYRHQDDYRALYKIASDMHTCHSNKEMIGKLNHYQMQNLLCFVNRECFEFSKNYFLKDTDKDWTKDLFLVYDSENPPEEGEETMFRSYPDQCGNRLYEIVKVGYPLIFNALDYTNKPIGFLLYHFDNYTITNYSRTTGITNAISLGIGGYINSANQRSLLARMDEMYKRDALTGLYNRVAFQHVFRELRFSPENKGKEITVIMSDLDGLKYINDHFGHADGDNAICMVANALKKACPEPAVCARFGGDEVFAVLIGDCKPENLVQCINDELDEYNKTSGLTYFVTTSSGTYTTTLNESFDILKALKIADENMYEVKKAKKAARQNS